MTVNQVMNKKVLSITPDTSIKKCWQLIFQKHIHGLPVVDKKNHLLGLISESELLKKIYPDYNEFFYNITGSMDFKEMEEKLEEMADLKAKDLMKKDIFTIDQNSPAMKALSIMIVNRIRQLPVLDDNKQLIGMISKGDIFNALYRLHLGMAKKVAVKIGLKKKSN